MKPTFILTILLLLVINVTYSQTAHHVNCGACVYNKNYNGGKGIAASSESCECVPCREKRNKEKAAKQVEVNRRRDALNAKIKAEREAKAKAFAAEQKRKEEEARKPKSGEVLINAQSTTTKTASKQEPSAKATEMVRGKLYSSVNIMSRLASPDYYDRNRYFTTNYFILNGDTVLKGRFAASFSIHPDNAKDDHEFPENIGIAILKETKNVTGGNSYKGEFPICDLVNSKGERILKNDEITFIMHFYKDWFVLLKGGYFVNNNNTTNFNNAEFYNIKTKQSYPLQNFSGSTWKKDVSEISHYVEYKSPGKIHTSCCGNIEYYRSTGTFKAALRTENASRSYMIYYLTNDNKIESDIFDYDWSKK